MRARQAGSRPHTRTRPSPESWRAASSKTGQAPQGRGPASPWGPRVGRSEALWGQEPRNHRPQLQRPPG